VVEVAVVVVLQHLVDELAGEEGQHRHPHHCVLELALVVDLV
jgi:hypothetical protein